MTITLPKSTPAVLCGLEESQSVLYYKRLFWSMNRKLSASYHCHMLCELIQQQGRITELTQRYKAISKHNFFFEEGIHYAIYII